MCNQQRGLLGADAVCGGTHESGACLAGLAYPMQKDVELGATCLAVGERLVLRQ